jgi:ABC-2 type transport system permease protein
LKKLFTSFWQRNLGCAKLAILSQTEYRFNFFTDTVLQPTIVAIIEVTIWSAIISATGKSLLGGFSRESYIAYALWAAFFARIGANWMYEFRMVEEINSGSVNGVLVRPISFYEYYLSQFLGYKIATTLISLFIPVTVALLLHGPTILPRLPIACAVQILYLVLVHTISFSVASLGFFFNRVHGFTIAKNIALAMLTGEMYPLDLVPEPFRKIVMWLPFSNSVYVPVGYLTGRLGIEQVGRGVLSIFISLIIFGFLARTAWMAGIRKYSGTGA